MTFITLWIIISPSKPQCPPSSIATSCIEVWDISSCQALLPIRLHLHLLFKALKAYILLWIGLVFCCYQELFTVILILTPVPLHNQLLEFTQLKYLRPTSCVIVHPVMRRVVIKEHFHKVKSVGSLVLKISVKRIYLLRISEGVATLCARFILGKTLLF